MRVYHSFHKKYYREKAVFLNQLIEESFESVKLTTRDMQHVTTAYRKTYFLFYYFVVHGLFYVITLELSVPHTKLLWRVKRVQKISIFLVFLTVSVTVKWSLMRQDRPKELTGSVSVVWGLFSATEGAACYSSFKSCYHFSSSTYFN